MLNIKTMFHGIYKGVNFGANKYRNFFMAVTTMMLAVNIAGIADAGNTLLQSEENSNTGIYVCDSEAENLKGAAKSQWETEKENCLSLENNYTFAFRKFDVFYKEEVEGEKEDKLSLKQNLSFNTYETFEGVITDTDNNENETEITEEVSEEKNLDNTPEEDELVLSDSSIMEDDTIAYMLSPGDLFEGEDGNILVANRLGLNITKEDYECLVRIVYAEAGNQGLKGKILVANVIINRVKSSKYANDIQGVVFQPGQFSPTRKGGSYYYVTPDQETVNAVNQALSGVDYSQNALYFCCKTPKNSMFNTKLQFLYKYKNHYFYKPKN